MHSLRAEGWGLFHPKVSSICCIRVTSVRDTLLSHGKGTVWGKSAFHVKRGLGTWVMDVEAWILFIETGGSKAISQLKTERL